MLTHPLVLYYLSPSLLDLFHRSICYDPRQQQTALRNKCCSILRYEIKTRMEQIQLVSCYRTIYVLMFLLKTAFLRNFCHVEILADGKKFVISSRDVSMSYCLEVVGQEGQGDNQVHELAKLDKEIFID